MKTNLFRSAALLLLLAAACDDFSQLKENTPPEKGSLCWVLEIPSTKADEGLPDVNDYLLSVRKADGTVLYDGNWGASPQVLEVEEGYYTVSVVSIPFTTPAFSKPQYGDEQVVRVPAGQSVTVHLQCTLRNAGIRLRTGEGFLEAFPDGILFLQQGADKLQYLYRETRVAYFQPGPVSVLLYQGAQFETLCTRSLEAREVLTLRISVPASQTSGSSRLTVQTDTSKVWENDTLILGEIPSGEAISVADVAKYLDRSDVWVTGYVVGGDLTSAGSAVKTGGITKNTHLALADRSSVTEKAYCLAVELPQGKVRDALNLVDHPSLIGRKVKVRGDLVEKYFGTVGMKGTSAYELP